jgi:hypothetical protein
LNHEGGKGVNGSPNLVRREIAPVELTNYLRQTVRDIPARPARRPKNTATVPMRTSVPGSGTAAVVSALGASPLPPPAAGNVAPKFAFQRS